MTYMNEIKNNYLQTINIKNLSAHKIIFYSFAGLIIIFIIFSLILLLFPQTYINKYIKNKIITGFAKSYPAYSLQIVDVDYNYFINRIKCNSVSLTKRDSSFSFTAGTLSLSGISWFKLFNENNIPASAFSGAATDAGSINIKFKHSQYQLNCSGLHCSVQDSEIVIDSADYEPVTSDDQFFAGTKFRTTRYRVLIPEIILNGVNWQGLFNGNIFQARYIKTKNAYLNVFINMDKPIDQTAPFPLMPAEALFSVKDSLQVDSMKIVNSRLDYNESYIVGVKPAALTFDQMQGTLYGIANHAAVNDNLIIYAQGNFMKTCLMKVSLSIPLESPQFSFSYKGSVSKMDLNNLNSFLETAEQRRIKSGVLQGATYHIDVNSGDATGYVRLEYNDLSVVTINRKTGSEKGIVDRISSFIAKTFKIRVNNLPDNSGSVKIGVVKYKHNPGEPFIQFIWLALRSGIGNIVGF